MDKFDRIFQLHAILSARRTPVPLETLLARLECSRATLYRAVTALKDQLNAPIVYDADAGGFRIGLLPIAISLRIRTQKTWLGNRRHVSVGR